jgi:hypothetical protein
LFEANKGEFRGGVSMPFVEVFTREELSDAVRAKLAETLLVTMMNLEIGHPTDHARAIGWAHTRQLQPLGSRLPLPRARMMEKQRARLQRG